MMVYDGQVERVYSCEIPVPSSTTRRGSTVMKNSLPAAIGSIAARRATNR